MTAPFVAEVVDYPNSQGGSGSNNPARLRETGSFAPLQARSDGVVDDQSRPPSVACVSSLWLLLTGPRGSCESGRHFPSLIL
jgi:hypothetical protein